jgi:hypothetical protein
MQESMEASMRREVSCGGVAADVGECRAEHAEVGCVWGGGGGGDEYHGAGDKEERYCGARGSCLVELNVVIYHNGRCRRMAKREVWGLALSKQRCPKRDWA